MDETQINKVTSHLSEDEKQQLYKNARAKAWYDGIWQNVGKCVFCDLKDKYIIYEENGIVLTINIYPYIDGQMMAIPRRHVKYVNELTQLEWDTMRKFSYIARKLFKKDHESKAMWSLVKTGIEAQGTVADHLHMHFIPFDSTDLCTWNFRELKYTPLENVAIYKEEVKEIIKAKQKFETKYAAQTSLPIICDVLIISKANEVLFQERKRAFKIDDDRLTLPGGHIDNINVRFEDELAREIKEEIAAKIETSRLKLIDSRVGEITHKIPSKHLKSYIPKFSKFVWNTYVYKDFNSKQKLIPGDDCEKLIWVPLEDIDLNPRISSEIKEVIKILGISS
jgi:diadenosine tetraphosphate (Ap4A) HIT family hydrolase/ADP-ribose pyrophosphatase YjhB (NUDIX family)